jgi:hypothetical protein
MDTRTGCGAEVKGWTGTIGITGWIGVTGLIGWTGVTGLTGLTGLTGRGAGFTGWGAGFTGWGAGFTGAGLVAANARSFSIMCPSCDESTAKSGDLFSFRK